MFSFEATEEQKMLVDAIHRFAESNLRSTAHDADEEGMLRAIFAGSLSKFREPVNLKRLITMIDEIEWSETDVDIKAAAYEGLLQKYAEEQKGAGQYFTPREVIRSVVRCKKPDIREKSNFSIHDPACGTGGFLIGVEHAGICHGLLSIKNKPGEKIVAVDSVE